MVRGRSGSLLDVGASMVLLLVINFDVVGGLVDLCDVSAILIDQSRLFIVWL